MKRKSNWLIVVLVLMIVLGMSWWVVTYLSQHENQQISENLTEVFWRKTKSEANQKQILDKIEITMTPEQLTALRTARADKYEVTNPKADFQYNGREFELKKLKTRGSSSHDFDKKGLSVSLKEPIQIGHKSAENKKTELRDFKLVNLVYDNHYFEDRLGYNLLATNQLFPLFYKYVAVNINDQPQGIYLLVEDPATYVAETKNQPCLLAREWYGKFGVEEAQKGEEGKCEQLRVELEDFYQQIPNSQGEQLEQQLRNKIDLTQYYRKMAIDYLLQNGDYTDEVFFYGDGQSPYQVMGWDYDDIFAEAPHEVHSPGGINETTGRKNGQYRSTGDIYAEIGPKLIFSIEDDLDYKIATDPYLYQQYLQELKIVYQALGDQYWDELEQKISNELIPLYADKALLNQSIYDSGAPQYSEESMKKMLAARIEQLKVRRDRALASIE